MGVSFSARIAGAWFDLSEDLALSRNARRAGDYYPEAFPVFHSTRIRHVSCSANFFDVLWVF